MDSFALLSSAEQKSAAARGLAGSAGDDCAGRAAARRPASPHQALKSAGCHLAADHPQQPQAQQQAHNSNRTTEAQTMMHILKANIGTGVLAMPNAFKNVGLWPGALFVPIIGAICIHCMNILIASHNRLCDRFNFESLDYDQVAALALASGPRCLRRWARWVNVVVTVFLLLTQFGFCCVYIMFVVENLQVAAINLFGLRYSTSTFLLLVFPLIGLTSCTSNLKHLARISTLANVLQSAGLALILVDLLQFGAFPAALAETRSSSGAGAAGSGAAGSGAPLPAGHAPVRVNQLLAPDLGAGLPLFFATAVYAFEGIGVVLPLIKEMQHPDRIQGPTGVLNTSMWLVALLYMAVGFFGYAKYGQFVRSSITLNLPETTLNELVRCAFALAIGLSYSLQFYVPWTIIWPAIDEALFYSYRPRAARDKMHVLDAALQQDEGAPPEEDEGAPQREQEGQLGQRRAQGQLHAGLADEHESTASTFATSYTMSTCLTGPVARRWPAGYGAAQPLSALSSASLAHAGKQAARAHSRRDRLEDVMEREDDEAAVPEVQWRPPPRSMRGKRKLVRYTVILASVSLTFVAAALIPRLDLFISLIGALASSCLAIIFPAIIQLCTFWASPDAEPNQGDHHDDDDQDDDDHDDDDQDQVDHQEATNDGQRRDQTDAELAKLLLLGRPKRRPARSLRRRLAWALFFAKNLALMLFGILGLITGSWISLAQLGAVDLATG